MRALHAGRGLALRGSPCSPGIAHQRGLSVSTQLCRAAGNGAPAPGGPRRGALVVFEGIDRCGKSTQCSLLLESLQRRGVRAELWRFPDRTTPIGGLINEYLQKKAALDDAVIHLLFVANRNEKREEMLRLLAGGTTLVLDRYSYSGVAYTAAKGVPHLDAGFCRAAETGLPAADLVVYLDLDPEQSAARGGFGSERYEKVEFQKKVRSQYGALADGRWLRLDASQPAEQLQAQVAAAVQRAVERAAAGEPLGRLWDYAPMPLPAAVPDVA
ncbi:hypothetical protein HXX76_002496 [Chlamydomonas incerta]|uniref:Thymidylate kinase n=1 Tax=Chlamydomonas incerta TaxID=51695 RepID=A0A835TNS5_CHLIN|nr:hypothetical protein HXX76_002496 [Chlamydomonas incerta]|eukprot:KAG2442410.1 hypothetical protein HXX76_002496 [Chlamydomonas incerta]